MMKETKRCRCNMLRGQRSFLVHSLSIRTKLCNTRGGTKVIPPFFFFLQGTIIKAIMKLTYRVIRNGCRGFNNLSYTIHLR